MEKIKIITDSTADLSQELYDKYDIEAIPLLINFGEESYLDGIEITPAEMFAKIKEYNVMPTTAQVGPGRFEEVFKKYLDEGYKILSIHMSSNMSGTYNSACIAKQMLESDDIIVIDSQQVTSVLGLMVLKAAYLREKGMEFTKIAEEVEKSKEKIHSSIVFESLEHLVKGGRISKTAGIVGSMLGLKILLEIKDGMMAVKDKIRGNKKALKRMISDLESVELDPEMPVILLDVENKESHEALKNYLTENNYNFVECPVGTTVSIHSGPKCVALAFYEK